MAGFNKIDPDRDPCLTAEYPAASLFKIVTAAAAVEEKGYTAGSRFKFNGYKHTLYKRQLTIKPTATPIPSLCVIRLPSPSIRCSESSGPFPETGCAGSLRGCLRLQPSGGFRASLAHQPAGGKGRILPPGGNCQRVQPPDDDIPPPRRGDRLGGRQRRHTDGTDPGGPDHRQCRQPCVSGRTPVLTGGSVPQNRRCTRSTDGRHRDLRYRKKNFSRSPPQQGVVALAAGW
jgi:hypothetical protein